MPSKTLYLIRGLAGTGKSTFAQALTKWNCAADNMPGLYVDGKYNQALQGDSHRWCMNKIECWLQQGKRKVAVHNTFVLRQWITPYENLASRYAYRFQVIHCEGEHGSIHNVPEEITQKWRDTWEPYQKFVGGINQ